MNNFLKYNHVPKSIRLIGKYSNFALDYARNNLKGRFPHGEEAISKDAKVSFEYARDVLKGPFPRGEEKIMKSEFRDKYLKLIGKK